MFKVVIFVFLVAFSQAAPNEAPAESEAFDINKIVEQAKNLVNDLAKNLPDNLKIDPKQAADLIQNSSTELAAKINKILEDVSVEVNKQAEGANKVLGNVAENLKGIKENLEKQYPEASAKAKEFQESFNKELNKLYEQGKILAENVKVAGEKLTEISKKVLDATIKTAEEIKKNVEEQQAKKKN